MGEGRWIVDVRGGVIGIYYASEREPGCAENWPEPCLRIDGERVIDPESGALVGWRMPQSRVRTAEMIAERLNSSGVVPQYEEPAS